MGADRLKHKGFSFLETVVSAALLGLVALMLLQSVGSAFQSYSASHRHWKAALELWNRAQQTRATPQSGGQWVFVLPQARPLYRVVLEDGVHQWEVLVSGVRP